MTIAAATQNNASAVAPASSFKTSYNQGPNQRL